MNESIKREINMANAQNKGLDKNVLGTALQLCSSDPLTGFTRSGCCETGPEDNGSHTVCAQMTDEFLLLYVKD